MTPIVAGVFMAGIGLWMITRGKGTSEKNPVLKILGWILIVAGVVIIISESFGFPAFWGIIAWILNVLGFIFSWLGDLFYMGRDAVNQML
jgi:hypothetical protein